MATTATPTILNGGKAKRVAYTLALNEAGDAVEFGEWADRSVQVDGTFGAGASVVIEGSNDGVNFYTLTDPQGNNLTVASAKLEQISEIAWKIRPRVIGGDGTTAIAVNFYMRGTT